MECEYDPDIGQDENCVIFDEDQCELLRVPGFVSPVPSWRIFVFVSGVAAVVVPGLILWLPESPKWQTSEAKPMLAVATLRRMIRFGPCSCFEPIEGVAPWSGPDEIDLTAVKPAPVGSDADVAADEDLSDTAKLLPSTTNSSESSSAGKSSRWRECGPLVTVVHALDDLRDVFSASHSRAAWCVAETLQSTRSMSACARLHRM